MHAGEDVEKGEHLHTWWECELVQPLWRRVWRFLNKLKIELPYDPAILLFGMHPEEMKSLSQRVNLYAHVHRSFIYNSQGMETT